MPKSARVVQQMGQKTNPWSFLLKHAMGRNAAEINSTAVAAGLFLSVVS